VTERILHYPVV